MPDRLFAGRFFVDGFERQRDLDQLFAIFGHFLQPFLVILFLLYIVPGKMVKLDKVYQPVQRDLPVLPINRWCPRSIGAYEIPLPILFVHVHCLMPRPLLVPGVRGGRS